MDSSSDTYEEHLRLRLTRIGRRLRETIQELNLMLGAQDLKGDRRYDAERVRAMLEDTERLTREEL
jgi:hypothetical protein